MHLFLAWSGKTSREVAEALHDWLPCVIQAVRPFISEDIEKGSRWYEELRKRLGETAYGIICVTQDNYKKPWINFESGAISNAVNNANVSPLLFNVEPSQLEGPLQQFQSTVYRCKNKEEDKSKDKKEVNSKGDEEVKEDFFKLVHGINGRLLPERQVPYDVLRRSFDHWWDYLTERLNCIKQETKTHTGYDWLYTTGDMANELEYINEDNKCKCVWIITPHVYRNVLKDGMKAAIINSIINKQIVYEFLIPDDDNFQTQAQALDDAFSLSSPPKHKVKPICEKKFKSLAVTDYLVAHPASMPVQVFLELPLTADQVYWIKVTDEAAKGFEIRFRDLLNDEEVETVGSTPHKDCADSTA